MSKYYIMVEINGNICYVNTKFTNFRADPSRATSFKTREEAEKAIQNINPKHKYSVFKPFMTVTALDENFEFPQNTVEKFSVDDYLGKEIGEISDTLNAQLKNVDLELIDLQHYMEFRDLNACEGYKAYKMMHDTRLRRRKIKDKIALVDSMKKAILEKEDSLEHRVYAPRILTDIAYTK